MTQEDVEEVIKVFSEIDFAYPARIELRDDESDRIQVAQSPGMTLCDYFAGQYMAAGRLPDEAYRLAVLAMKERSTHG